MHLLKGIWRPPKRNSTQNSLPEAGGPLPVLPGSHGLSPFGSSVEFDYEQCPDSTSWAHRSPLRSKGLTPEIPVPPPDAEGAPRPRPRRRSSTTSEETSSPQNDSVPLDELLGSVTTVSSAYVRRPSNPRKRSKSPRLPYTTSALAANAMAPKGSHSLLSRSKTQDLSSGSPNGPSNAFSPQGSPNQYQSQSPTCRVGGPPSVPRLTPPPPRPRAHTLGHVERDNSSPRMPPQCAFGFSDMSSEEHLEEPHPTPFLRPTMLQRVRKEGRHYGVFSPTHGMQPEDIEEDMAALSLSPLSSPNSPPRGSTVLLVRGSVDGSPQIALATSSLMDPSNSLDDLQQSPEQFCRMLTSASVDGMSPPIRHLSCMADTEGPEVLTRWSALQTRRASRSSGGSSPDPLTSITPDSHQDDSLSPTTTAARTTPVNTLNHFSNLQRVRTGSVSSTDTSRSTPVRCPHPPSTSRLSMGDVEEGWTFGENDELLSPTEQQHSQTLSPHGSGYGCRNPLTLKPLMRVPRQPTPPSESPQPNQAGYNIRRRSSERAGRQRPAPSISLPTTCPTESSSNPSFPSPPNGAILGAGVLENAEGELLYTPACPKAMSPHPRQSPRRLTMHIAVRPSMHQVTMVDAPPDGRSTPASDTCSDSCSLNPVFIHPTPPDRHLTCTPPTADHPQLTHDMPPHGDSMSPSPRTLLRAPDGLSPS